MALENGGLDAQITQRMDAYRSNPQQLQQRYGQNKELLDLLALQKLTSEKQAAARDMQMSMQAEPVSLPLPKVWESVGRRGSTKRPWTRKLQLSTRALS